MVYIFLKKRHVKIHTKFVKCVQHIFFNTFVLRVQYCIAGEVKLIYNDVLLLRKQMQLIF